MNELTLQLARRTKLPSTKVPERRELVDAESKEWDVIVVGAGPAGSLAARQLAIMGCKTLLIDKCEFPRQKVCGGCLNGDAVAMLQHLQLGHLVSEPQAIAIDRFELSCDSMRVCWNTPSGAAVSRALLDESLVAEARSAGAVFLCGTRATVGDRIANSTFRQVILQTIRGDAGGARGRIVIVADGLHQMSVRGHEPFRSTIAARTRIGLGATFSAVDPSIETGIIKMNVHAEGYVGMVRIPGGQTTIAAAVDARALQRTTPAELIERLFGRQQLPPQFRAALHEVEWRGTGPLTRTSRSVASDDILLVGDASGYVEPFTGEGMAWSFRAAAAAATLVAQSLQSRDDHCPRKSVSAPRNFATMTLAQNWITAHRRLVGAARRRCGAIAWGLRHPRLARATIRLLSAFPGLAKPLIQSVFSARRSLPAATTSTTPRVRPRDPAARFHS